MGRRFSDYLLRDLIDRDRDAPYAGMSTLIVKTEYSGRKRYAESERRELLRKYGRSGMTQALKNSR